LTLNAKADRRSLRQINRSLLVDLIRAAPQISRSELARRSGLAKPTVSAIVEELIEAGLVRELGSGQSARRGGRPARLLEFNAASAAYLGLQFGLAETRLAVADGLGTLHTVSDGPVFAGDPARSLASAADLVTRTLKALRIPRARVQALGATVPGLIDQPSGVCRLAPNLDWQDVALRDELERRLRLPAVVHNVTQASAVAEGRVGAARGVRSFAWLYLGDGVGSAAMIEGRVFTGVRGFAGELGHCRISDEPRLCGCGKTGHLEAFVSSMAIVGEARAVAAEHPESLLARRGPIGSVAQVVDAASAGDEAARRLFARVGARVGVGVGYLVNLLDPECVVLGGDIAAAGEALLAPVRQALEEHALLPDGVRVVGSRLGDRAGLMGSVLLAMDHATRSYRFVAEGRGA